MTTTKIEWTRNDDGSKGLSWNCLRAVRTVERGGNVKTVSANHCEPVNEACRFCYADRQNARLGGLPFKPGHRKDYSFVVDREKLLEPLRRKKPTRIFVESMSDAFGEWWPDSFIDQIYAVMALTPQHTYINLSKRPERRRTYLSTARAHPVGLEALDITLQAHALGLTHVGAGVMLQGDIAHLRTWPLPNVIEGTSVSCQKEADDFIPILLNTRAALRAVSCEPLLGPLDLRDYLEGKEEHGIDLSREVGSRVGACIGWTPPLDWVIVGGESGPKARPFDIDWARAILLQCAGSDVAAFMKQLGSNPYSDGRPMHGAPRGKYGDPAEWPPELRVRQFPELPGRAEAA